MSELAERPADPVVGMPVPHESARLHVTGTAAYTDDLSVHAPGVLTAWPVQSANAHARVTTDVSGAYRVPGVVRVLTADDVPGVNDAGVHSDEPLFPREAMYHGHALVWVLGETPEAARLGAAAVTVEYEPLPSIITIAEAIAAESFQGVQRTVSCGDPEAALAAAAFVFEGVTECGGQEHFYLETQAALAVRDSEGQYFVQSSTQHPSETQEIVAQVLGVPSHEVTVQSLRMGGGFGGKEMQPHGLAAIAALGAKLTRRPVRLRLNRTQDLTMTGKRHPFHIAWRAGFDDRGGLLALDATLTSDGGWCLDLSEPVMSRALSHIDNAYWIPNVRALGRVAKTHKPSNTAFRGFGGPQGSDADRRHPRSSGARARHRSDRAATCELLPSRPEHALRADGEGCRTHAGDLGSAARRVPCRRPASADRHLQRRARARQARDRDDPDQVRHLVQLRRLQPGRRPRPRLP